MPRPNACARDGATVINIAVDGKLAGLFAIADPVKASTAEALRRWPMKASRSSC